MITRNLAGGRGVTAEEAKAILEAKFALGYVIATQLTPVASRMPRKKFHGDSDAPPEPPG